MKAFRYLVLLMTLIGGCALVETLEARGGGGGHGGGGGRGGGVEGRMRGGGRGMAMRGGAAEAVV